MDQMIEKDQQDRASSKEIKNNLKLPMINSKKSVLQGYVDKEKENENKGEDLFCKI
jgi:hypothetical protein